MQQKNKHPLNVNPESQEDSPPTWVQKFKKQVLNYVKHTTKV